MQQPASVATADLHIHPSGEARSGGYPGSRASKAIYAALRASHLQVAVLADHDRIDVARDLVARSRADEIRTELVVGEEITSRGGHLVGVGLTALVPADLSLAEAVAAVHEQGGLAVVAHPLLPTRTSATALLLRQLAEGDTRSRPDAVEAMHPLGARLPGWRRRVAGLAQRLGYAVVGGSDAHVAGAIGRARTCFRGGTAAELAAAVRARETWTEGRPSTIMELLRRR